MIREKNRTQCSFSPVPAIAIVLIFLLVNSTGCSSNVSMVPELTGANTTCFPIKVRVADVENLSYVTYPLKPIPNEMFQEALIATLEKAHIFQEITDQDNNVELYAIIRDQRTKLLDGYTAQTTLIVEYAITEKKAGRVLWRETYLTECARKIPFNRPQGGGSRYFDGAIHMSLTHLIDGLQTRFPGAIASMAESKENGN